MRFASQAGFALAMATLVSCATTRAPPPAGPTATHGAPPIPSQQQMSAREQQVSQSSTGAQAGRIHQLGGNTLELQPYQAGAGLALFELPSSVPVFRENQHIGDRPQSAGLKSGSDVDIYYADRPGQSPLITGIRILNPAEAEPLKQSQGTQPGPQNPAMGGSGPQPAK